MRTRFVGVLVAGALAVSMLGVAAPSAAAADEATLNVVHGIPGVDVDVCVNGTAAITDFTPGEVVTTPIAANTDLDVKIVAKGTPCTASGILGATLNLATGKNYSAVAYLMEDGTPALKLFKNNVSTVAKGLARVTVRHTAAAPAVDVWANGAVLVSDLANGKGATASVPKGVYAAWVSLPGDYEPVAGPAVLKLAKGTAYQVYAWGDGDAGYAFAVVATKVGVK